MTGCPIRADEGEAENAIAAGLVAPVEPCGMFTILLFAEDRTWLQYASGFDLAGHVSRNDVPDAVDKVHIREAESAKSAAARNSFAIAKLEADDRDRRRRMQGVAAVSDDKLRRTLGREIQLLKLVDVTGEHHLNS
jgi:hypothetical protein